MRWGNFKEASAWSEVHGHATRHTKSTVTTCLFSFLLIGLSDFFYACSYRALRGRLRPTCLFCLPQTTFHTADSRTFVRTFSVFQDEGKSEIVPNRKILK